MEKRLLVVDDEPGFLRALEGCLCAQGFDVTTARSGPDALVKVAQAVPDLVVSDIRMPGMTGYQIAQRVHESPRTALVPVVLVATAPRLFIASNVFVPVGPAPPPIGRRSRSCES